MDPVWWISMHAISSYRGNRRRPPARPLHTHRQHRLQYTAPQLASAQCIECRSLPHNVLHHNHYELSSFKHIRQVAELSTHVSIVHSLNRTIVLKHISLKINSKIISRKRVYADPLWLVTYFFTKIVFIQIKYRDFPHRSSIRWW